MLPPPISKRSPMVRFITGPSGSGKSEFVYSSIENDIKNGNKVILLVPEQEVLRCERILAERLDGVNSLGLEVVSFRRLCNRIFREYGGLCKNYITGAGRAMLMWRALSELSGSLSYFTHSDISDGALIDRLLSFIGQMKAYKISPVRFADCAEHLKGSILRNKAADLASVYLRYDALLHADFDDTAEDIAMTHNLLMEHDFFADYSVYVDSYYGFTPAELDVMSDIFKTGREVTVSLLINSGDDEDYDRLVYTKNKLTSLAKDHSPNGYETVILNETPRFSVPELAYLSANIWNHTAEPIPFVNRDSVTVAECPDCYKEAAWIAADIRKSVRCGLRYSDIAVITRDPTQLQGVLDVALESQKIPYHMSKREDITVYPLVRFLIFALKIIDGGWKRSDLIGYIKTGIAPIDPYEVDILENYVSMWDINGSDRWNSVWNMNPAGFRETRSENDSLLLDKINDLRERIVGPIYDLSQSLSGSFGADSCSKALYSFITACGAQNCVDTPEDVSVWNALIGALDVFYSCGGQAKLDVSTLLSLLKTVFDHTDIGSIPSFADEVTVAGAPLARIGSVKRVYVCSVNDGVFPSTVKDDLLFSNRDLEELRRAGIDLDDGSESRANDELLYFARAISCASESLCISYSTADMQGKKIMMSYGVKRVLNLLSGADLIMVKDLDPIELTEDKDSAFRTMGEYADTAFGQSLAEYFSRDDSYRKLMLDADRPLILGEYKFNDDVTSRIFSGDIALTQSRVESFTSCPFKYACTYVFKIPDIRDDRYNTADIGTFIHSILEQYFERVSKNGSSLSRSESVGAVDSIIDEYIKASLGSDKMMNARTQALFRRLRRTALALVADIEREFIQSDFKPSCFELGIGTLPGYKVEPISVDLSDSDRAFVYGFIDRVDTCNIDGDTYVRIVDYKTGDHTLKKDDVQKGKNLQMLLYLFSICSNGNEKLKKELGCEGKLLPAGVEYYMAHAPRTVLRTEDEIYRLLGKDVPAQRHGFVLNDKNVLSALDKSEEGIWLPLSDDGKNPKPGLITKEEFNDLEKTVRSVLWDIGNSMKSGECSTYKGKVDSNDSPCRYCAYRPICRKEEN